MWVLDVLVWNISQYNRISSQIAEKQAQFRDAEASHTVVWLDPVSPDGEGYLTVATPTRCELHVPSEID